MATLTQYPHFLFAEVAAESTQDERGNWSDGEVSRNFISMCRDEPDGKGTEYQVAGGQYVKSTALIQAPVGCPKIEKGAKVIVANDKGCTDIRIAGIVLNFSAGQLHTRIWV